MPSSRFCIKKQQLTSCLAVYTFVMSTLWLTSSISRSIRTKLDNDTPNVSIPRRSGSLSLSAYERLYDFSKADLKACFEASKSNDLDADRLHSDLDLGKHTAHQIATKIEKREKILTASKEPLPNLHYLAT